MCTYIMYLRTALALGLELGSVQPYYALQDLKKALKRQVKAGTQFAVHLSEYPATPADLPQELFREAYVDEKPLTQEEVNEFSVNKASSSAGAVSLRRRKTSDALALVPASAQSQPSSSHNAGPGIETLVNGMMGFFQELRGLTNVHAQQQQGSALNNLQVFKTTSKTAEPVTEPKTLNAPVEPVTEPKKAEIADRATLPTAETQDHEEDGEPAKVEDVDPKLVAAALQQRKVATPKPKAKGKAKAKAAAAKAKASAKPKAKAVAKTKAKAAAAVSSHHAPKDPGLGGGTVWWGGGKIQCNHPEHYRLFIRTTDRCDRKIRRGSGAWARCLEAIKNGP